MVNLHLTTKWKKSSWVDVKIPITNSLNLDFIKSIFLVEVDDRIVNTSQWEVKLPEKGFYPKFRSIFWLWYKWDAQPFFSRRIGISSNKDGELIENKIIYY